jgi:hypothetical protein
VPRPQHPRGDRPGAELNCWLAPLGLTITAQHRASERRVRCEFTSGWGQGTTFTLMPATETDDEPSTTLALPESKDGATIH